VAVASLASMYKQHIGVEDNLVFPLAARMLSDVEKMAIAEFDGSRSTPQDSRSTRSLRKSRSC
jgi:hemerythrin-like domain-containing protein